MSGYRIHQTGESILEIRQEDTSRSPLIIFFLIGSGILYLTPTNGGYWSLCIGLLFCLASMAIYLATFFNPKFDLNRRVFTSLYPTPPNRFGTSKISFDDIERIHALDRKIRRHEDFEDEVLIYELRLILANGRSINLLNSSSKNEILNSGNKIGSFVGKKFTQAYENIGT